MSTTENAEVQALRGQVVQLGAEVTKMRREFLKKSEPVEPEAWVPPGGFYYMALKDMEFSVLGMYLPMRLHGGTIPAEVSIIRTDARLDPMWTEGKLKQNTQRFPCFRELTASEVLEFGMKAQLVRPRPPGQRFARDE